MQILSNPRLKYKVFNFGNSFNFYHQILNLPLVSSWDEPENKGAIFQLGSVEIEIIQDGNLVIGPFNCKISVEVENVQQVFKELSAKIIGLVPPKSNPWGQLVLAVFDPNGLNIEFYQTLK
ncbi:MAG: hypothetical protein OHK0017_01720 [Patescibacteria group bacterium]